MRRNLAVLCLLMLWATLSAPGLTMAEGEDSLPPVSDDSDPVDPFGGTLATGKEEAVLTDWLEPLANNVWLISWIML